MKVIEYSSHLLPELTQLINQHICSIPPAWTLSEAQVASALKDAETFWMLHFGDEEASPTYTTCVVESGHLAAACQWNCWVSPNDAELKIGMLDWIAADPKATEALDALLATITHQMRQLNCVRIMTSRFMFGVGWLGIPTTSPHLIEGMQRAGFQSSDQWVIMTVGVDHCIHSPSALFVDLKWNIREANLEWDVEAYVNQSLAGECQAWGIPTYFRGCGGFKEWITVEWLGVEEPYRRQGIGRLLMGEQMRFQAQRGIKNVIVWTETNNAEARKFNESLGFQYGPECWSFVKTLD
jgi:GNAT superfamily N-acetyltransferase